MLNPKIDLFMVLVMLNVEIKGCSSNYSLSVQVGCYDDELIISDILFMSACLSVTTGFLNKQFPQKTLMPKSVGNLLILVMLPDVNPRSKGPIHHTFNHDNHSQVDFTEGF